MLGKLIKHEFLATARLMAPSYIAIMVIALLGRLFTWLSTRKLLEDSVPVAFLRSIHAIANILSVLFVLAFIALVILTIFYMVYRFYKNFFTDQGYLMMTLPTKPRHLIFSKLINAVIWALFSAVIAILSMYIALGTAELVDNLKMMWNSILELMHYNENFLKDQLGVDLWVFAVELVIFFMAYIARFILSWYFAIAFGQLLWKKHKILGAIVAYLLLEIASNIISSLFMAFDTQVLTKWIPSLEISSGAALQSTVIGNGIVMILVAALLYWLTARIMTRKLNLD